MKLTVESSALSPNQPIPRRYTGDAEDFSPPLRWSGVPQAAKELALVMDDPDAPRPEPWVHWIIYKIPPQVTALDEGLAPVATPNQPAGAQQGKNSWGSLGYRGPAPPRGHGVHHYHFRLYALDTELGVAAGLDKDELLRRMQGHVLAEGELVGTYQR